MLGIAGAVDGEAHVGVVVIHQRQWILNTVTETTLEGEGDDAHEVTTTRDAVFTTQTVAGDGANHSDGTVTELASSPTSSSEPSVFLAWPVRLFHISG